MEENDSLPRTHHSTRLNLLHLFDLELYTLFLFIFEVDLLITHKREPLIYVASLLLLLGHEIL